jgi:hypothetical protein
MQRSFWNKVPRRGTAAHATGYTGLRRSHRKGRNALTLKIALIGNSKIQRRHTAAHDDARTETLAIAEGYIPSQSSFSDPALIYETACILSAGDIPAHVRITVFFADREPVGPYLVTVEPRRTLHLRFNDLDRPAPIPRDTPYSSVFESDAPIVVQHTRLDSRHAEMSLLSTVAYAEASPR